MLTLRYTTAIQLFTEAIELLPETQASCLEHAIFLCDRALAHYDLKDFNTAVKDCTAALSLKPELAIAHFRLGEIDPNFNLNANSDHIIT
jgi:tetratricopeptide (TPR) repeat protein